MLTSEFVNHFAQEWIEAWNAHDMERILSHYSDDFDMTSPVIVSVMGDPSGHIQGKAGVREYWTKALARMPDLQFELLQITSGMQSIALYYRNTASNRYSIEWFLIGDDGKCVKSIAQYGQT